MSMLDLSERIVELAIKNGACDADAIAISDTSDQLRVRHGTIESVEREDSRGIGLRAFVDQPGGLAFASACTSDVSDAGLERLARQVLEMARISSPDPDAVPPAGAVHPEGLTLAEEGPPAWDIDAARQAALECEQAALDHSSAISNSEGAEAGFGNVLIAYASADGFSGGYAKSSLGISVSVIAGQGDAMQRDYDYAEVISAADLPDPAELGRRAASRAERRLGASGMASGPKTLVFEPRIATSLLGHLCGAINGRAVLQQLSFLASASGERIFPEFVSISDDPARTKGLGNRPFDGEGMRTARHDIIDHGVLTGFMADRYAAGRLGIEPTGHARRGLAGDLSIGPSNMYFHPGELDQPAIIAEIGEGLLVTELIGFGVNGVTGDYSRGAAGFLIENGQITRPVAEITIAGNLKDMFAGITHVGSDLTWFGPRAAPSVAIGGMTIAGQG
ncbi:MAG: TldD/PmbA family protein [Mariprofundaceae bacterium]